MNKYRILQIRMLIARCLIPGFVGTGQWCNVITLLLSELANYPTNCLLAQCHYLYEWILFINGVLIVQLLQVERTRGETF